MTTDLKHAKVDPLVRLYVTGHSLGGEIMSRYESIALRAGNETLFGAYQAALGASRPRRGSWDWSEGIGHGPSRRLGIPARTHDKDLPDA